MKVELVDIDKMTVLKLMVYLYQRDAQMNGSKETLFDRCKAIEAYEKAISSQDES